MISLIADARRSIEGVARLVLGKSGFAEYFDISQHGLARSFSAALLAAPIYALTMAAIARAVVESGNSAEAFTVARGAALYAVIWLHFPLIAAPLAALAARRDAVTPWIIVHNWTVLALLALQSLTWILYLAGALPAAGAAFLAQNVYIPLSLFVHWRVAQASLSVSWGFAAGLACAHVLVNIIAQQLVVTLYAAPAQ